MADDEDAPPAALVAGPVAIGFLAGGLTSMPALAGSLPLAALAIGLALTLLRRLDRASQRTRVAAGACGLGIGACAAALAALPLPPDHLARLTGPASAAVTGTIVRSERAGERVTLTVAAEHVRGRRRHGVVTGYLGVTIAHAQRPWRVRERVRIVGRLRRPRNFANPGGYDLEGALARRGVRVTMFLWDDRAIEALPTGTRAESGWTATLEARVEERLAQRTTDPVRGFLAAVLLGSTQTLDSEMRTALARSGLAHVVSVSGFHVAVAAGTCVWLGRWIAVRSPLALRMDVTKLAMLVGLLPLAGYAAIAGESVPAGRAFAAYGVVLAAVLLDRRADGLRALAVAALLLALPVPNLAADISFQLSFVSVLGLVLVMGGRTGRTGWRRMLVQPLVVSVAATVVTAPLTAWHFQQVSLVAPLANLVGLPLLGPATLVPGLAALPLVAVAPAVADALLDAAALAAAAGLAVATALARLSWAAVATPLPSPLELLVAYAALALWWWAPTRRPRAWRVTVALVATLAIADAAYWSWQRWGSANLRVTFLAVGQGDAAVVELPGGAVLVIDGGGFAGDFDPGERLIAPFLRSRKIGRIDALVLSHPQLDHYGGLAHLAERFAPREIWWTGARSTASSFARLEAALAAARTRSRVLRRGMRWSPAPGVAVEVLHPDRVERYGVNDASLVLHVTYGHTSFLFSGDIERDAEAELLRSSVALAATVLKVPHHGSATSSSAAWLAAVAPTVAVVSSGIDNRFGFPAPVVLRRLRAAGATTWNTAEVGAVRVVSDGRRVATTVAREPAERQRFEIPTSLW